MQSDEAVHWEGGSEELRLLLDFFCCEYGGLGYAWCPNDDANRTVILLHGLGASHKQLETVARVASDTASVLLIDLPAHGHKLAMPGTTYSFDTFCNLILCLVDSLRLQSVNMVGISMGSALALMCAAKRPELVQHLIVVRPAWLASAAPEHLSLIDRCGQWLTALPVPEALARLHADPEYLEMCEDVPLAAASIKGVFERPYAKEHAPVLSAMYHSTPFHTLNELRAIKVPSVVIGSHADHLHPIGIANATAKALPNARLQILPPRYLQPEKHQAALSTLILDTIGVPA